MYILKFLNKDFYLLNTEDDINYDDWFISNNILNQKHLSFNESVNDWRKVIASTKILSNCYLLDIDNLKEFFIDLIGSTELNVEIEMRSLNIDEIRENGKGFLNNPNLWIPNIQNNTIKIIQII